MSELVFRGGRLPNDPHKPRLKLAHFLDVAAVNPPPAVDWYSRVTSWPVYLNDSLGDCTCADLGHTLQQTALYGDGTEVRVTDADILTAYKAVSGYNGDPSTDNGAVIQDVMSYWRKTGVAGHKSLAFAEVNVADTEVKAAIAVFGSVHFGMNFPAFAMDQFNAGQPWTLSSRNTQNEGGHDVVGVGYDTNWLYVVTWGQIQKVAWSFVARYFEEAWAAILPEWVNDQSGTTPTGLDLHALGERFTQITGEPNPFPPGTNPPGPPPPHVGGLDVAVQALRSDRETADWVKGRHLGHAKHVAGLVRAILEATP